MNNSAKFLVVVLCVALVGVILWKATTPPIIDDAMILPPEPQPVPKYLAYSDPYRSNGVIGNVMPSRSNGQAGQPNNRGSIPNFSLRTKDA